MRKFILTLLFFLSLCVTAQTSTGGRGGTGTGDPTGGGRGENQFSIRLEEEMGNKFYLGNEVASTSSSNWTPLTSTVRRMAANFLVEQDWTTVSVTFSAEAWMEQDQKSMYVRLLVDGQPMEPSNVLFADGRERASRAFTFTDVLHSGLHTVEVEWQASRFATAFIKDASLLIRQSGGLTVVTPESGPSHSKSGPGWVAVPNMGAFVFVADGETLTASMSAESYVTGGGRFYLRATAGGQVMNPGNVIFASGNRPQSRKMTFGMDDLPEGWYWVQMEWAADNAATTAHVGDRTLEVSTMPTGDTNAARSLFTAAASGATVSQLSEDWANVPDMTVFTTFPQNATVAVQFNGEMWTKNDSALQVRLVVAGTPVPGTEVELTAESDVDTHSFVLDAKNINVKGDPLITAVQVQWRKVGGDGVFMGDRAMNVLIKPGDEPDFAEPAHLGMGELTVDPHFGKRRVVTILIDPKIDGAPINATDMDNFLWNNTQNVSDYYDEISNGRLQLENVATLGWYDLKFDSDHYWNANYDCNMGDTFTGGHQERWAEALTTASDDFDFSQYDLNKDGLLDPRSELGIVLIVNQDGSGSGVTRALTPYCNGNMFTANGVIIPEITETYISGFNSQWLIVAHELGHHLFTLGDMYVSDHAYDPGRLSLMSDWPGNTIPHLDAANKLWLGWVEPKIVEADGAYTLADIRDGGEVLILPRKDSDGKEYFILENRQTQNFGPGYDQQISASGIAVWHVVEDTVLNNQAPNCVSQAFWNGVSDSNARRGIRLVRPTLQFSNVNAAWNDSHYDLLDFGLLCPGGGNPTNILNYADGTASGYSILNWSIPGPIMGFDIFVP